MALALGAEEASSSSNTTFRSSRCSYDVFFSYRDADTRHAFTDHLYSALVHAYFRTFYDTGIYRDTDTLERGEDIKPKIEKAIQESRSSVIVFSKKYASSRWCLNELVMILQQKKTSDHVVFPVFYDVDPSHVRKQTGSLAKAFARHQKTQTSETVKGWREALAQVADLPGMAVQNKEYGHKSEFITKIVKVIEDRLRLPGIVDWKVEWTFLVTGLSLEIFSLAFDQASTPSKPQYALFGMLLAIAALLTGICELIYKGKKQRVELKRWGRLCWFFHPSPQRRLFGTLPDMYGLVGGLVQCICSTVEYVFLIRHAENPIKVSPLPAIFLICLAASRLGGKSNVV